jgi:hypothetical protein
MKIKVFYDKNLRLLKIPVVLKIPHGRIASDFVVDTGSPHTILNYTDSIRLSVPHNSKAELVRIGGRVYQSYLFNRFTIVLKSENNEAISEDMPIRILIPNSLQGKELEALDKFPNLLGMDFLERGYKFYCDISKEEINFQKD